MSDDAWEQFDALQRLLVQVARLAPGFRPAEPLEGLLIELYGRAISPMRNIDPEPSTLDDVTQWVAPQVAGSVVGFTARRVQQLCAAGTVRARRHGRRSWLVDLADLHRHLRKESA